MFHIETQRDDGTWVRFTATPLRNREAAESHLRKCADHWMALKPDFDESRLRVALVTVREQKLELLRENPDAAARMLESYALRMSLSRLKAALGVE